MTTQPIDDCFAHSGQLMRHSEALALLRQRIVPVAGEEAVPLAEATGRIAARGVQAQAAVPGATNAAVDGYAFAASDYDPARGSRLEIKARITAGHPTELDAHPGGGAAARIFTGAVIPAGCDTVAMQEDVRSERAADGTELVMLPPGLKRGANVRPAGEDVTPGTEIIFRGQAIRPQDLAQLASLGIGHVTCYRRLSVGLLSTGDEIVRVGEGPLQRGQVYDANAPLLAALISGYGAKVTDYGIFPDRPEALRAALAQAAAAHDVVVTSGGASRGEEDHLVAAVEALGRRHLWQIAVKPGRPLSLGQIGGAVIVGLPGNPVAVFVCTLLYVRPLLLKLGGGGVTEPRRFPLPAAFAFRGRKPGRREFWRGLLVDTPDGLAVDKFRRDGSGLISGLRASDGLIDIPEARGDIAIGDLVDFIPYSELGLVGARHTPDTLFPG